MGNELMKESYREANEEINTDEERFWQTQQKQFRRKS